MNITGYSEISASVMNSGRNGTVHSVYKNSVNLIFDGQIVSLQPAGSTLTPLSLLTDCPDFSLLRVQREDVVFTDQHRLQVAGKYVFCYGKQTPLISTRLVVRQFPVSTEYLRVTRAISDILEEAAPTESIYHAAFGRPALSLSQIYLTEERSILEHAGAKHAEGDVSSTAFGLSELIGLGPGLTPSGDDFLIGVLFALDMGNSAEIRTFRQLLWQKILEHVEMTTDLSGQFLRCAGKGYFAAPLLDLHSAVFGGDKKMLNETIRTIATIGHSSGCDTLSGILWVLKRFCTERRIETW